MIITYFACIRPDTWLPCHARYDVNLASISSSEGRLCALRSPVSLISRQFLEDSWHLGSTNSAPKARCFSVKLRSFHEKTGSQIMSNLGELFHVHPTLGRNLEHCLSRWFDDLSIGYGDVFEKLTGAFYAGNFREWSSHHHLFHNHPSNPPIHSRRKTHQFQKASPPKKGSAMVSWRRHDLQILDPLKSQVDESMFSNIIWVCLKIGYIPIVNSHLKTG